MAYAFNPSTHSGGRGRSRCDITAMLSTSQVLFLVVILWAVFAMPDSTSLGFKDKGLGDKQGLVSEHKSGFEEQ